MKKYINKLFVIALSFSVLLGCKEPENALYDVFDGLSHGAALRGLAVTSSSYDINKLDSKFELIAEVQDEQDGALLSKVDVYVTYTDKFSADGANSKPEAFLKAVESSSFTTGDNGYPTSTIGVTLDEVINLFGFSIGDYNLGDLVDIRFEIVLSDGRTFSSADGSGSLQGSYFSSPYAYTAAISCPPLQGDYRVAMHDSYGDGWQTNTGSGGDGIQVTIVGADGVEFVIEVGMCTTADVGNDYPCVDGDGYEATDNVTVPAGALSWEWYFPGDTYGEISFEVYEPDGTLLYTSPQGAGKGSLPIVKCSI